MRITEFWSNLDHLIGRRVQIEAMLFVNDEAFVAENRDSCVAGRRLKLIEGGAIYAHLNQVLAPWGGGQFPYHEFAVVDGIVRRKEGEFELVDLTSCTVTCLDRTESFVIPLRRPVGPAEDDSPERVRSYQPSR